MEKVDEIEIIRQIRNAIKPLTEEEIFYWDTFRFGTFRDEVELFLVSEIISITFHGYLGDFPEVKCAITVPSVGKEFTGMYLFPAMNLDIQFSQGDPAWDVDKRFNKNPFAYIMTIPEPLPEKNDFFQDLNRLCSEIQANWMEIQSLFECERIEKTIHFYSFEFRKHDRDREIFQNLTEYQQKDLIPVDQKNESDECIEKILLEIALLERFYENITITYQFRDAKTNISCYPLSFSGCKILFHTENDGSMGLYFILGSWLDFLKKGINKQEKKTLNVFSYVNVFRMLKIGYSYHPKGCIEDIREFVQLISDNSKKILHAFSREYIEKSYNTLKNTPGNNQDEINRELKGLKELID